MPRTTPNREPKKPADGRIRLQRLMADAGVASRRACEEMIEGGRVAVNGEIVTRLPVLVDPRRDEVEVDGSRLNLDDAASHKGASRHVYVMLYKPRHTITTMDDPDGRRTVAQLVQHPSGARLYPVGRLDIDTMGLMLLTNDGELTNALTHPRHGVHKTYRAIVKGQLSQPDADKLAKDAPYIDPMEGRMIRAPRTAGFQIKVVRIDVSRTIIDITLAQGPVRHVREILARAGNPVRKLVRIAMGPVVLKGLRLGEWRELTTTELSALRKAAKGKGPKGLDYTPSAGSTAMRLGDPRSQDFDENDDLDMPRGDMTREMTRDTPERSERPARQAKPARPAPGPRPARPVRPAARAEDEFAEHRPAKPVAASKPKRAAHPLVTRVKDAGSGGAMDGPVRRVPRSDVGPTPKNSQRPQRSSRPARDGGPRGASRGKGRP